MKEIFDCAFCLAFGVEPRLVALLGGATKPFPPVTRVARGLHIYTSPLNSKQYLRIWIDVYILLLKRSGNHNIPDNVLLTVVKGQKAARIIRKRISKEPYTLTSQSSMRYPRLVSNRVCHTF